MRESSGSEVTRVSQAWLAMLVPVALMTATIWLQHLERRLLGPPPATEGDPVPRAAAHPKAAAPPQPAS